MGRLPRETHERAVDLANTNSQYFETIYGTDWFLPAIGLALFCLYLSVLNIEAWSQLKAVCEAAIGKDALTLCLQYGAR